MKVIFITREDSHLSGARVRCYAFSRQLQSAGIESAVLSYAADLGALCGEKERLMTCGRKISLTAGACKKLAREGRDAVFVIQRFNYHSFAPLIISWLKGNRVILDMDDWDMNENPVYRFGFYPSSKAEFLTRKIASASRACIGASHYLCDYLRRFNADTVYIPTGVDTRLFMPSSVKPGDKVIISWAGMVYHPPMRENLFFLLECFREVALTDGNARLEIAGEGAYYAEIGRRAAEMGLGDKVRLAGWVAPDAMGAYLDGVDIGVVPLTQNTRFNNAKSPTKLFEYMAKAKPVVASPTCETTRVIRHGVDGFIAAGKKEYVASLARLCADAGLRRAVGANARLAAEQAYSLEACGKRLVDLITRQ